MLAMVAWQLSPEVKQATAKGETPGGVQSLSNLRVIRIVRITRLVRLTRIARITRFIKALRTLVSSIVFTLKSLVWALVLLFLIMYGFGIVFTQAAVLYARDNADTAPADTLDAIQLYWADLYSSILTLFMSIAGGISWEVALRPMMDISPFSAAWSFSSCTSRLSGLSAAVLHSTELNRGQTRRAKAFSLFAVLNVVTGETWRGKRCDTALRSSVRARSRVHKAIMWLKWLRLDMPCEDLIMQNIIANKEAHIQKVKSLFTNLDADDSGYISLKELEENMNKKSAAWH